MNLACHIFMSLRALKTWFVLKYNIFVSKGLKVNISTPFRNKEMGHFLGGKSSTKCDNSRDRETTVFIVIISSLVKQKKYITVTYSSCRKSFQDRQCSPWTSSEYCRNKFILHHSNCESLLNVAWIGKRGGWSLFYTGPVSFFPPFYSNRKITHHLWNQCNTQIYFSTYIFLFFFLQCMVIIWSGF